MTESVGETLSSIPFFKLIGEPLIAVVTASVMATNANLTLLFRGSKGTGVFTSAVESIKGPDGETINIEETLTGEYQLTPKQQAFVDTNFDGHLEDITTLKNLRLNLEIGGTTTIVTFPLILLAPPSVLKIDKFEIDFTLSVSTESSTRSFNRNSSRENTEDHQDNHAQSYGFAAVRAHNNYFAAAGSTFHLTDDHNHSSHIKGSVSTSKQSNKNNSRAKYDFHLKGSMEPSEYFSDLANLLKTNISHKEQNVDIISNELEPEPESESTI